MQPVISVIMPIYNSELSMKTSIKSVLDQSYKDFELILINDGSQDESKEICNSYSNKDSRVVVINQKNQGVSVARNKGLEVAKGKYINFIDSDDSIELNAFEILIKYTDQNDWDMVIYGMSFDYYNEGEFSHNSNKTIDQNIKMDKKKLRDNFFYLYDINYLTPIWNKLIKRSLIQDNNIKFNSNMAILEDFKFTMDVLDYSQNVLAINKCLYKYSNEISVSSFSRRTEIDYIKNFNILDKRLRKTASNMELKSQKDIERINCMIVRSYIIYLEFLFYSKKTLKEKYTRLKEFIKLEEVIKSSEGSNCKGYRLKIINFLIKNKMKNLLFIAFYIQSDSNSNQ